MAKQINHLYEFGSVRLDATNRLLYKDGEQLSVQPRVIDTLLVLVENAHSVVDKETILDAVWKDVAVEEGALKRNIYLLRNALGEEARFIETLPKRGYRLSADVKERWEEVPVYVTQGATSEVLVERRANLRITHEEEISDSSDPPAEVPAQDAIIQQTPGIQTKLISSLRRYGLPLFAASMVALAAVVGLFTAASRPVGTAASPIRSLAVLPFKNLSSQGEDVHFGTGLADMLITRLSSIKDLNVRPMSAVLKFSDNEQDPIAAGQALGVDAVIEGSIYSVGDQIRVTARLVRVSDQSPVWSGQFNEKADDFLLIQNNISQQVVGSLAPNLTRVEKDALGKPYTESEDAYQLYVTGRYHWNKRSGDGIAQSEGFFRRAIEKDPDFALAYAGLADSLTIRGFHDESVIAIQRAIELDDKLGEAYASRGFWKMFKAWQWDEAEADFKRAIELKPGYGTAHQWYATLLALTGRVEEAKAEMRRALEIDPTSHNFLADLGQMHYFAREYDEAETYSRKALEIYPDFGFARGYLIQIYLKKGEVDRAFEEEMSLNAVTNHFQPLPDSRNRVAPHEAEIREEYRRAGYEGLLRKNNEVLLRRTTDFFNFFGLFKNYALLGEKEKALEALEKSFENRDFMLPFANIDPLYDDLRSDPRFQSVMRRMNLSR
ncbi:MAG TPA: tetratricopeptide repeat protein [Blastocatellia bacterium]|nr:tetratricopeptide repeat protein [Blastocatellia bacterium]